MPLNSALRSYLDSLPEVSVPAHMSDREQAQLRRSLMLQALANRSTIPGLPNGVTTRDVTISSLVTGRLYTPAGGAAPLPLLVYAHGGGWVCGSVETHDPFCRLLSQAAGILIFSIGYRLAPEHPFPAAMDDMLTAYLWAIEHAPGLGADAQRLLLGGDSAGANLAAVITNRICASREAIPPAAQLLLYPVMDHPSAGHSSYAKNSNGYGLAAELMTWFWNQYAQHVAPDDTRISPLRLDKIPSLPPTLVATAEYDPLRDEGLAYADKLAGSGVAVTHLHSPDMHHNFPVHPGTVARFPQSLAALEQFAQWIRHTVA